MFPLPATLRMLALCAVLGLALSACDRQQVAHWLAPTDQDAAAKKAKPRSPSTTAWIIIQGSQLA